MRILSLLLALLLLCPALAGAQGVRYIQCPKAEDRLHLRTESDEKSVSLGRFYSGTVVEAGEARGGFTAVRVGPLQGYMRSEYLSETRPAPLALQWAGIHTSSTDYVNLRAGASTRSQVLEKLPFGTVAQILGREGEFYHVRLTDVDAYIQSNLLQVEGELGRIPLVRPQWAKPAGRAVNLRAGPSQSAPILAEVSPDTLLQILDLASTWYYVEMQNPLNDPQLAQRGFIQGNLVELWAEDTGGLRVGVVNTEDPARQAPFYLSPSDGDLSHRELNGIQVEVLEDAGDYWRVRLHGDWDGYVRKEDLLILREGKPR